ncbi:helix-turn-helix transcriptional regulator [Nocardioides dongxiaopingii]|uniref:helix-turn-helix domain-containing protein n=1 Tax=Nocardioides sp. S-1144 TaxID=2582905 RepID=UPI0011622300|nr:AraC family transcriptional regulator [Nocardioides sp. S-1144]QDH10936.1 helix-turn-helix transcriptional regulator [Nocardioides sp. S-1144]
MSVPGVLAPYVAGLVPYDVCGEPGVHIGMPSTHLTLVLAVDEPLDVGWAGGARVSSWANVAGLHPGPAEIRHGRRQRGVYLDLTVAGARALFGLPAGALAGALADVADVDPALRGLPEQLAATGPRDWAGVVTLALTAALARHDAAAPRAEVGRALARLTRGAGVAEVADEVGYSRRHLGDLVRAECGVSPQEYRRLARFERSHALVRDPATSLADAAARCGYADQSHLTREWVVLAGCSPSQWRHRELPSVQAREPAPGAG